METYPECVAGKTKKKVSKGLTHVPAGPKKNGGGVPQEKKGLKGTTRLGEIHGKRAQLGGAAGGHKKRREGRLGARGD